MLYGKIAPQCHILLDTRFKQLHVSNHAGRIQLCIEILSKGNYIVDSNFYFPTVKEEHSCQRRTQNYDVHNYNIS